MGNSQSQKKRIKQFLEETLLAIYPPTHTSEIRTLCRKPIRSVPHNVTEITFRAQPVGNDERIPSIIDSRNPVRETSQWPNSVHGVIRFKMTKDPNEHEHWGTGILIGPNIVLTAGHNIYSHGKDDYSKLESMEFIPGMNGDKAPFGSVKIKKYFVTSTFRRDCEREDFGILILKEPVGDFTGFFGLACLGSEKLQKKKVTVTGYPADKVASKPHTYEMWEMQGNLGHIKPEVCLINYIIYASAGQSGGGVWFQEEEEQSEENYYVCGVHVKGDLLANKGTLLTTELYKQIYNWFLEEEIMELFFSLGESTILDFPGLKINAQCVKLLMKYNLDKLTSLKLHNKQFGIKGAKILAENNSWSNLQELHLSSNNIGAQGLKALAENVSWINLSILDLSQNKIGRKGAGELAKNKSWVHLSTLNLNNNKLGDRGAKELAKNDSWRMLAKLLLSDNKITPKGERELARNSVWIRNSRTQNLSVD